MEIKKAINIFLEGKKGDKNNGRKPNERYSSFDFCFNYFYSFYEENKLNELANDKNLQISCLQLGFYLASWGMMRGSSFLIQKSAKNYEQLIKIISKMEPKLWEIDVMDYNEENIKLLINCVEKIRGAFGNNKPTDTLVTKIMLGVFANIPALDSYFKKSFKVYSLNKNTIKIIKTFYDENSITLEDFKIYTLDFFSGKETKNLYTKAKLIDMYGFIDGKNKQ